MSDFYSSRSRSKKGSSKTRRRRYAAKSQLVVDQTVQCTHKIDTLYPLLTAPRPVFLEPFPNARINDVALVCDCMITCHKGGIRLFKQKSVPTEFDFEASADMWFLSESRTAFEWREAYLAVGLYSDGTPPSSFYQRYFAVATGSDRSVHSVCVSSVTGHFIMHHELHGNNKIVCMNFSLVRVDAASKSDIPLVVSADEMGFLVVYNIDKDIAFPILRDDTGSIGKVALSPKVSTEQQINALWDHLKANSSSLEKNRFSLEKGTATTISFCGPCTTLCGECGNPMSALDAKAGYWLHILVSLRGRDIHSETSTTSVGVEVAVVHLRVLVLGRTAVVVRATPVWSEVAPLHVCEAGPGVCSEYLLGPTPHFLLSRPGMKIDQLSGCTGKTLRSYAMESKSVEKDVYRNSLFLSLVPLGERRVSSPEEPLYRSYIALMNTGTLLLVGRETLESKKTGEESPLYKERQLLNHWLDEMEGTPSEKASDTSSAKEKSAQIGGRLSPLCGLFYSHGDSDLQSMVTNVLVPSDGSFVGIALRGDIFLQVNLPFWTAAPPPCDSGETEGEPEPEPSNHPMWESAKRLARWSPSPSSWTSYFTPAKAEGAPEGTTSSSPRYDFSLTRPLMSALFRHSDPSPTPPRGENRMKATPSVSLPPSPPPTQRVEEATRSRPLDEVDAVPVEMVHFNRYNSKRRMRGVRLLDRSLSEEVKQPEALVDTLVRQAVGMDTMSPNCLALLPLLEAWGDLFSLSFVEEQNHRSMILLEEKDTFAHLYLDFYEQYEVLVALLEKKRRMESIHLKKSLSAENAVENLAKGIHSPRFLDRVLQNASVQKTSRSKKGFFNFGEYFSHLSLPSFLSDLQERDRCFYELNDLQLRQQVEQEGLLDVYSIVEIFQNEERTTGGDLRQWRPHRTFPFDNAEGNTVDLSFLNRTADFEKEDRFVWVKEETPIVFTSPTSKRTTLLSKELRHWEVGPWEYASRWPSPSEMKEGKFSWSPTERASHTVRRRRLTRRRMDLVAEKERNDMIQKHLRQVEELRLELNL